ncbi:MAG: SDR family oxidoreductase [Myxococcaceae bacterium]|nr:SDR family oxidoreductase [Myxococcaceae bacterium]
MSGKRVLVTGATNGIGLWAAIGLARLGAEVVVVGRDPARTAQALHQVRAEAGSMQVQSLLADLSSMASVRALAAQVHERYGQLHVLLNNAGGINLNREVTVDGYERTFATNHLSYFLLTSLLLPLLEKTPGARVVNVASEAHRRGPLDFDDLMSDRGYRSFTAYSRSKLANILFTFELARRLQGTGVTANCMHPGVVGTNFLGKNNSVWALLWPIAKLFLLTPQQGAQTAVFLASSPEVNGVTGEYFARSRRKRTRPFAHDVVAAKRLWEVSEKLVGLA